MHGGMKLEVDIQGIMERDRGSSFGMERRTRRCIIRISRRRTSNVCFVCGVVRLLVFYRAECVGYSVQGVGHAVPVRGGAALD